jgi:protein gp37
VFCASLADVFDNQVPDAWRQDLWELISVTPHLDWLLLTKRPQNIGKMLPKPETMWCGDDPHYAWPWPNVWLGTTVENQEEADRRIPHLLSVPAPVHFLWCEPLLGPVDLSNTRSSLSEGGSWRDVLECGDSGRLPSIDWVIAGGESGPGARPSHPDWFRSLRDQCQAAGAAFFFKQWGEWWPEPGGYIEPLQHQVIPLHLWPDLSPYSYSVRLGKKRAGALLDGREWREVPNG